MFHTGMYDLGVTVHMFSKHNFMEHLMN